MDQKEKLAEMRMAANIARTLRSLIASQFEGERDYVKILGYVANPSDEQLLSLYEGGGLAKRVVDAYPSACWRNPPTVTNDPDNKKETQLGKAWDALEKKFRIFKTIRRADRLANICRFSVILLGVSDSGDFSKELGQGKLLYLQPYGSRNIDLELETDPKKERFGLPVIYKITPPGQGKQSMRIHHSRIIHIAEDCLDDDIYGVSRLRSVYNKIVDISFKLIGGSAEMFWRNAQMGIHLDVDPNVEITDQLQDTYKERIQDFYNGLERFLLTQGGKLQKTQGETPDPTGAVDCGLQVVSADTGIPKRILTGSERGELASSQDETNWNDRVKERQEQFCDPDVLTPLQEKLQFIGALPKGEIVNVWEDLTEPTAGDKADLAYKLAQGAEIMSPGAPWRVFAETEWREAAGYDAKLPEVEMEHPLDEDLLMDDPNNPDNPDQDNPDDPPQAQAV